MAGLPNLQIFGLREEAHADIRRACKLHTDSFPRVESNPGPWHCLTIFCKFKMRSPFILLNSIKYRPRVLNRSSYDKPIIPRIIL
eukprot:g24529.t1